MNTTPDTTTSAGNGDSFDPRQAAALLDQTTAQTRRKLQPYPPWLLVIRACGALAVFGTIWLSVRGQHPYKYPTAAVIPVAIAFGILNLTVTVAIAKRATAGISGRSRLRPGEIAIMAAAWIGVFAVLPILAANGASNEFVYGTYPAAVPLMVAGVAAAAVMAARSSWRQASSSFAIAIVGAVAFLAGPVGSWAVAGVGIFLELLATAAFITWQQRRGAVRP